MDAEELELTDTLLYDHGSVNYTVTKGMWCSWLSRSLSMRESGSIPDMSIFGLPTSAQRSQVSARRNLTRVPEASFKLLAWSKLVQIAPYVYAITYTLYLF